MTSFISTAERHFFLRHFFLFCVFVTFGFGCGQYASAAVYYIDPVSGNDANIGTSPEQAWATLQKVNLVDNTLLSGDIINIKAGHTYALSGDYIQLKDTHLTLQRWGDGARPIITTDNANVFLMASGTPHLTVTGLAFDPLVGLFTSWVNGAVVTVDDCVVPKIGAALSGSGSSFTNSTIGSRLRFLYAVQDITISNCTISADDGEAIWFLEAASHITIAHNTLTSKFDNHGMRFDNAVHNALIEGNTVTVTGSNADGICFHGAAHNDVAVRNNTIHTEGDTHRGCCSMVR